jgi:NAD+ dependent glucose-6-phosphate dehydrogenase
MRVIITGAAGRIGSQMVNELIGSNELCLIDRCQVPDRTSNLIDLARSPERYRWRDTFWSTPGRWAALFEGASVVLHLAGEPSHGATWQRVLYDNIQATWNVISAWACHRIARVVYASSNWAVKALERELAPACYAPGGPKIGSDAPPRPITPYSISKAIGEQIGRMFVDEGRLASFVAVRIGHYRSQPPRNDAERRLWIGAQDIRRLLRRCVEADIEGFHVVYGTSAQPTSPFDLSHTRRLLSWEPQQLP